MCASRILVFNILIIFIISSCSNNIVDNVNDTRGGFVLTFDDAYVYEWYSIHDVLETYDAKATFFVTRFYNLTDEEINLLHELDKRGHEIGSHSYSHQNALEFIKNHSVEEYVESEIISSLQEMGDHGFHVNSFAFPYGDNNEELNAEVLKYVSIIRDVTDIQRTTRTIPVKDIEEIFYNGNGSRVIYGLGIDNIFQIPLYEIDEAFERARNKSEIIIFYAHKPDEETDKPYEIEISYLEALLQKAQSYCLKSYTVSELLEITQ